MRGRGKGLGLRLGLGRSGAGRLKAGKRRGEKKRQKKGGRHKEGKKEGAFELDFLWLQRTPDCISEGFSTVLGIITEKLLGVFCESYA